MFDKEFYIGLWGVVGAVVAAVIGVVATNLGPLPGAAIGALLGGAIGTAGAAAMRRKRRPPRPYAPKPGEPDFSPAHLLVAHRQVVGFVEFGQLGILLADFVAWAVDGMDVARILTGTGGVGKTRFAIELSERLRGRGLVTWFVPRGGEERFVAEHVAVGTRGLLIVDYAEGRPMLDHLISDVVKLGSWKVLLLARSAGEWSEPLGRRDDVYRVLDAARQTGCELKPLIPPDQVRVAQAAASAFGRALDRVVPTTVQISTAPAGATVLELHAAVLLAMLDEEVDSTDLEVDLQDVYHQLLRHEANHWCSIAETAGLPADVGVSAMMDVAAAHALVGADHPEELDAVLKVIPFSDEHERQWRTWIARLYPGDPSSGARIPAIAPDRLAEYLVTTVFEPDHVGLRRVLEACSPGQLLNAVLVLARAHADDFRGAQALLRCVVDEAARILPDVDAPVDLLEVIDAVLPQLQMSEEVAKLALGIVEGSLRKSTPSAATSARLMARYAARASAAGEGQLAVKYADQAVKTFRALTAHNREQYEPALASALNNLAIRLEEDGGDSAGSIEAAREALEIRERLASASDRYLPALAQSLSTLAVRLSGAGHYSEAVELSSRSAELYRSMDDDPGDAAPRLARSLINSAQHLIRLRRAQEALSVVTQGVSLYEVLADTDPAAYRFSLSSAYMNEAQIRYGLEDLTGALRASRKAIEIREDYAEHHPERFEVELVRALNNHSVYQYRDNDDQGAVTTAERAQAIAARWKGVETEKQLRALAELYTTLANAYTRAGRLDDSLRAGARATELLRQLESRQHGSAGPSLARSLHNQARRLQRVGRPCEGIPLCIEAVTLRSALSELDPAHHPELKRSLMLQSQLEDACPGSSPTETT